MPLDYGFQRLRQTHFSRLLQESNRTPDGNTTDVKTIEECLARLIQPLGEEIKDLKQRAKGMQILENVSSELKAFKGAVKSLAEQVPNYPVIVFTPMTCTWAMCSSTIEIHTESIIGRVSRNSEQRANRKRERTPINDRIDFYPI